MVYVASITSLRTQMTVYLHNCVAPPETAIFFWHHLSHLFDISFPEPVPEALTTF